DGILNREPESPVQLNPALPPKLEEIINKLLEKDLDLRYQSAAELRGDLKRLKRDSSSSRVPLPSLNTSGATTAADRPASSSREVVLAEARRHKLGLVGTILLLVLVGTGIGYGIFRAMSGGSGGLNFQNISISKITDNGRARAS